MVKDFSYECETEEPEVSYKLEVELVDPGGYYEGVMSKKEVVRNMVLPLVKVIKERET